MPAQVVFDADFTTREGSRRDRVTVHKVIVGGWTGRDRDALQHHIDELAKIGVRANALVLSSERSQRLGRNAAGVEIEAAEALAPAREPRGIISLHVALGCLVQAALLQSKG